MGMIVHFALGQGDGGVGQEELRSLLTRRLALAAMASLALSGAVAWWVHRQIFVPLQQLVVAADRIASGAQRSGLSDSQLEELAPLGLALNRLAVSVEEQIATLAEERNFLQTVVAAMSEAVLVIDGSGRAEMANQAFLDLFAIDGDVHGRTVADLVPLPDLAEVTGEALSRGESRRAEMVTSTVPHRMLVATASPLAEHGGAVVVVEDISDFVRLAEVRRDLVANVSHEIKTPLAAIRGYIETMLDSDLPQSAETTEFLDRSLLQCGRLQAILEDLLTLSRIESSEAMRQRESLDLQHLLFWAADLLRDLALQREIDIRIEQGPAHFIDGDREALERLVINLLDNAIKYNRPGGQVTARLRVRGDRLSLEVEDDGIGIPPAACSRVFERFYRVDKGRSRNDGGTGLGLAIVKHAARLHGGQVEVESRAGVGSTFRVDLPRSSDPRRRMS